jgi:hypothetical protein
VSFTFFTLLPNGDIQIREQNGPVRVIGPTHPDYRRLYHDHFSGKKTAVGAKTQNILEDLVGNTPTETIDAIRRRQKKQRAIFQAAKVAFFSYAVVWFAYLLYSSITGTGVGGWVIDQQFRMFGKADETVTRVLVGIITAPPGLLLAWFLAVYYPKIRKAWPPEVMDFFEGRDAPGSAAFNWQPGKSLSNPARFPDLTRATSPSQSRKTAVTVGPGTRKWWLLAVLGPPAISLVVAGCLILVERQKDHKIYRMDLNQGTALPTANANFIYVTGAIQEDYRYALTRQENSSASGEDEVMYYTPLTPSGWTRSQPIHYVLFRQTFREFEHRIERGDRTEPDHGSFAGAFLVEVYGQQLPTYVKSYFEKAGIRVGSPFYVVNLQGFGDDGSQIYTKESPPVTVGIVLFVGGILSFFFGFAWAGTWWRTRRLQGKA